jgi:hypothetical protein
MFGFDGEVTVVDSEYRQDPGERLVPYHLGAIELRSGRVHRLSWDALQEQRHPPYPVGTRDLVVAFQASAEMSFHHAMGWPDPVNLIDVKVEFQNLTNGRPRPFGNSLLGASAYFGLPIISTAEKEAGRAITQKPREQLIADEWRHLGDYCHSDVQATSGLLRRIEPYINIQLALLRGRYMTAVAHIENAGIPLNMFLLDKIRANWTPIRGRAIQKIDRRYNVFEHDSFRTARWERWLQLNNIPWPRLDSGNLALDSDTFKEQALTYPIVAPMYELRQTLGQLHLNELAIGKDGRNRTQLWPFAARTGRNQPSNSKFIFGPARWIRRMIMAPPGHAVAYIDFEQQEFGIAAAISGDAAMLQAYRSGDAYLAFAKQAGAAPSDATKDTHAAIREQFKECALGTLYSMGPATLAQRTGLMFPYAEELLAKHHSTYSKYWQWSDRVLDYATLHGHLYTTFGWTLWAQSDSKPASFRNFPMQANGAEMLRLSCCLALERGVKVIAPIHDALLIEAPAGQIEEAVTKTKAAMAEASRIILRNLELRTEVKIFQHPQLFSDKEKGLVMWRIVRQILRELEGKE